MERQEKISSTLWYIHDALFSIALLISNGTIFQGFLLDQGFSNEQIGIYSTLVNIVQANVMFFASGFVDSIPNIKKMYSVSAWGQAPLYGLLLLVSQQKQMNAQTMFVLYMIVIGLLNLLIGFRTVITYKIPFLFLRKEVYGRFSLVSAIAVALFGAVSLYIASAVLDCVSYQSAMPVAFCISIVAVIASGSISFSIRQTCQQEQPSATEKKLSFGILKKRVIYAYIFPNLARGLSAGILGMIAVFAVADIHVEPTFVGKIAFISQLSYVLAYSIYLFVYKYTTTKIVTLIGSAVYSVALMLLAFAQNEVIYLFLLGISYLGAGFFAISIPIVVAENVSYNMIGGYTSWRMLIATAGIAAGSAVGCVVAGKLPTLLVFSIAAILQMICGIAYYRFPKDPE